MKKWAKKNLVEVMLKGQALMMKKAAYVLCEYKNRVPADCGPELYTVIIVQCVATRAHAGTVCGMLFFSRLCRNLYSVATPWGCVFPRESGCFRATLP